MIRYAIRVFLKKARFCSVVHNKQQLFTPLCTGSTHTVNVKALWLLQKRPLYDSHLYSEKTSCTRRISFRSVFMGVSQVSCVFSMGYLCSPHKHFDSVVWFLQQKVVKNIWI